MTYTKPPKPMHKSMTVQAASVTAIAFLATLIAKWTGFEVSPELQQAILVLGGAVVAWAMRRGIETSRVGR